MLSCVFLLYHEKLLSHPHFWLDSCVPSTSPILPQLSPTDRPLYNTRHWPNSSSNHFQLYDILSQRVYIYIHWYIYIYIYVRISIFISLYSSRYTCLYITTYIYIYIHICISGFIIPRYSITSTEASGHYTFPRSEVPCCLEVSRGVLLICWNCLGLLMHRCSKCSLTWLAGWWFGTFFFSIIYGIILPID